MPYRLMTEEEVARFDEWNNWMDELRQDWWRRLHGWDKPPFNYVKLWERLYPDEA